MIDLQLDQQTQDLTFDDDLHLTDGVQEVMQAVATSLRTRVGEFFADDQMGLDQEYVLGKAYNAVYAAGAISDCIMEDQRVVSVGNVELVQGPKRTLTANVSFVVDPSVPVQMEVDLYA
ncbi:hypothetical protein [Lacticaseibacillus zhaodongensis]|uniref:hypothetical protein n=1 Tax=Lacticaseibacillus zhaodongensis TaxID=2668065 RepID=UPI0012D2CB7E|nr:hypothetical protein [Lacticaseibacillus zhaodongensis]